jgi:hypothetical protein
MEINQVNSILKNKTGRIDIMMRFGTKSIAHKKEVALPYDIVGDVTEIFEENKPDSVRINLYTEDGLRPINDYTIDKPFIAPTNSFQGFGNVGFGSPSFDFAGYEIARLTTELAERKHKNNTLQGRLEELKDENSNLKEQVRFSEKEHLLALRENQQTQDNSLSGVLGNAFKNDRLMDLIERVAFKVATPENYEVSNHESQVKGIQQANESEYSDSQQSLVTVLEPFIVQLSDLEVNQLYTVISWLATNKAENLEKAIEYINSTI